MLIKILFLTGVANIIFLLASFFSCRCFGGANLVSFLFNKPLYQKFYSFHCKYWWGFYLSVLAHTFLAFYLFGWPF